MGEICYVAFREEREVEKGVNDGKIWALKMFLKKVKLVLYVVFIVVYWTLGSMWKDWQLRDKLSRVLQEQQA